MKTNQILNTSIKLIQRVKKNCAIEVGNLIWANKLSYRNYQTGSHHIESNLLVVKSYCYQIIFESHCIVNRSESYSIDGVGWRGAWVQCIVNA